MIGDTVGIFTTTISGCTKAAKIISYGTRMFAAAGNMALGAYQTTQIACDLYDKHHNQGLEWDSESTSMAVMGVIALGGAAMSAFDLAKGLSNFDAVKYDIETSQCFVAGTLVLTDEGNKPIEEIKAGDLVYSTNPETGESEYKEVVQTFENETNELVHLTVKGDGITTTPKHPFYVPHNGWISAIDLRAGDILLLSNGEYVTVEKVQHEILEEPVKVYNFEVKDFHTYYVGENSILVHNKCENDIDTYANFNKKSERGDEIDGHELLQNAWLKEHGYIYERGSGLSRQNIALGVTEEQHKLITKLQREAGMFTSEYLKSVSWKQNIVDNMYILSEAGVSQDVIDKLYYYTNIFALNNKL